MNSWYKTCEANRVAVLKISSTKFQKVLKVTLTKFSAFNQDLWNWINTSISFKRFFIKSSLTLSWFFPFQSLYYLSLFLFLTFVFFFFFWNSYFLKNWTFLSFWYLTVSDNAYEMHFHEVLLWGGLKIIWLKALSHCVHFSPHNINPFCNYSNILILETLPDTPFHMFMILWMKKYSLTTIQIFPFYFHLCLIVL